MGMFKYMDEMMESKLSGMHTAYLAKVLSISGRTAKIQPLGLYKDSSGATHKQSVLTAVPISKQVRTTDPTVICNGVEATCKCWQPKLEVGDIVVCICCEQNISEAKRGVNALPPAGRFNMSDSIIIGVL